MMGNLKNNVTYFCVGILKIMMYKGIDRQYSVNNKKKKQHRDRVVCTTDAKRDTKGNVKEY